MCEPDQGVGMWCAFLGGAGSLVVVDAGVGPLHDPLRRGRAAARRGG
ncbi:hypothetical protein [Actinoallomurus sp. NPDC050550]